MPPLKIAILMPSARMLGGAEATLAHLVQEKERAGIEPIVVFLEEGPLVAQFQDMGISTFMIPAGRMREIPKIATTAYRIARLARREGVLVIVAWMGKAHLYGSLAARIAHLPALWFQHGTPKPDSRLDRLIARLPADGILACSQAVARAQMLIRPVRSMRVVYPGVDLRRVDPALLPCSEEARQQLGLPIGVPIVGIVGRLQRWKGIHVLIEAMPDILAGSPEALCVVVGGKHDIEPEYGEFLQERIHTLRLENSVCLVGAQNNVPVWIQAMDVCVHASDNEPFGMVIIEAMALGKPVIAGSEGGPSEIIQDGVDGLLAPYGDPERLARAVRRCFEDDALARRMGASALWRAQAFSTERYAIQFGEAVRSLCSLA